MSDFLLEPLVESKPAGRPEPAVLPRPATLGGIDWAEVAAEGRGQIALVEVEPGEGELQEWGRRGEQS